MILLDMPVWVRWVDSEANFLAPGILWTTGKEPNISNRWNAGKEPAMMKLLTVRHRGSRQIDLVFSDGQPGFFNQKPLDRGKSMVKRDRDRRPNSP